MGQSVSLRTFDIVFDNASKTYTGGDIINGQIVIDNNSDTEIKGIQVILRGGPKAKWKRSEVKSIRFSNSVEKILGYTYFVLGDGRTSTILLAGRSNLPFQFTLPTSCPSSRTDVTFYETDCDFKYSVQARILSSSSGVAHRIKENITVNAKVDLNLWPDANQPVVRMLSTDMKSSGILSLVIKIPRTGFIPGQVIPVELHAESGGSYKCIKIELMQDLSYPCPKGGEETIVRLLCKDKIPGGTYGRMQCKLLIPDDAPTSCIGFSNFVEMQHYIRVKLEVDRNTKQSVDIPVMIGNVPVSD